MSERLREKKIQEVIRIGKFTSSRRAGGAIAHNVRNIVGITDELGTLKLEDYDKVGSGDLFMVQASGTKAIYTAVRAIESANSYLQSRDIKIGMAPYLEALSNNVVGVTFGVSLHKISREK